ncbi:hypothetical protein B0H13DRAFT_2316677 [Mycena leptocephala]|nr:hypothetical protein B0H13DRAFT_2316677 [Mycena leptocephala]
MMHQGGCSLSARGVRATTFKGNRINPGPLTPACYRLQASDTVRPTRSMMYPTPVIRRYPPFAPAPTVALAAWPSPTVLHLPGPNHDPDSHCLFHAVATFVLAEAEILIDPAALAVLGWQDRPGPVSETLRLSVDTLAPRAVSTILMGSLAQEGAPCFVVSCPLSWLPPSHPALSSACRLDGARAPREKGVCLDCRLLDTSRTAGVSSCKGTAALLPIGSSSRFSLVVPIPECLFTTWCSALALLLLFSLSLLLFVHGVPFLQAEYVGSAGTAFSSPLLTFSTFSNLVDFLCALTLTSKIPTLPSSVDGQDVVVDSTGCQDKNEEKTVPCSGVSCASPTPIPETHALPASAISMGSTGSRAQEGDIRGFVFRGWAPGVVSNASREPFQAGTTERQQAQGYQGPRVRRVSLPCCLLGITRSAEGMLCAGAIT